jgi:tRNA modification GTPase
MSLLTARGVGGIAVIRLCGGNAAGVLRGAFVDGRMKPRGGIAPGRIAYGFIVESGSGEPADEVLVARVGEEEYDVNCHGGHAAVREVMRVLRECGAEEAGPEEVLERGGLLAGRDAAQKEAYRLILSARSERAVRHLIPQFEGALSGEIARIAGHVKKGAHAEARGLLDGLLRYAAFGVALTQPPRVVIAGRPNAGKSSLLNALVGRERVIVHERPGTTRDVIEEMTLINGVAFVLSDTAGLRMAADDPERQGIARARAAAEAADCVLVVFDLAERVTREEMDFLARIAASGRPVIACLNKCDLTASTFPDNWEKFGGGNFRACRTSCVTEEGMENLRELIYTSCVPVEPESEDGPLIFTRAQRDACIEARAGLEQGEGESDETIAGILQGLLGESGEPKPSGAV